MYVGRYEFQGETLPVLDHFWLATVVSGTIVVDPAEATAHRWFPLADPPELAFSTMRRAIADVVGLVGQPQRALAPRRVTPNPRRKHMTADGIITAIIVGAIIGALGRLVLPGRQAIPVWLTIVVGIVAALLGTVIANALGVKTTPGVDWIELFIQVLLAAVGVALVAGMSGRRSIT